MNIFTVGCGERGRNKKESIREREGDNGEDSDITPMRKMSAKP